MLHECRVQAQLAELETQLAAQGRAADGATKSMAQASLDQCSYPRPSCGASAARHLTTLHECRVQAQLAELETQLAAQGGAVDGATKSMAQINRANAARNFQNALRNVSARPGGAAAQGMDDVFARRSTRPMNYWATGKKGARPASMVAPRCCSRIDSLGKTAAGLSEQHSSLKVCFACHDGACSTSILAGVRPAETPCTTRLCGQAYGSRIRQALHDMHQLHARRLGCHVSSFAGIAHGRHPEPEHVQAASPCRQPVGSSA